MTLWALIFLCAGNCADFHTSAELVVNDCEQASLAMGMDVVTTEHIQICDMGMCMETSQTRPIKPHVIYTVCKQIDLVQPKNPCDFVLPWSGTTCTITKGPLRGPYPPPVLNP